MKTVFIKKPEFTFTEGDVLKRMGMPEDHEFGKSIKELLADSASIVNPKAFYMEATIENRTKNTVTIGGETFTSVALVKNLKDVDVVYPCLCTCGVELADYGKKIEGMMEQYAFDAIMEFYYRQMRVATTEALVNTLAAGGQVSAVNPGSLVDWHIDEQHKLFKVFGENAKKIGVELNENSLMFPIKTVSGILYPTDKAFHNCDLCQKENCPSRESPFDLDLYMETLKD